MIYVPLDRVLDNPFNTRSHYDDEAVAELADSIERDGQLQTPIARLSDLPDDHVFVVDGVASGDRVPVLRDTSRGGLQKPLDRQRFVDQVLERHESLTVQLAYGHTRARAWRLLWERRAGELLAGTDVHGCPPGFMPVELRPLSDDAMERVAWEENERRRDLDPVDRAAAIAARVERHGWTHEEAGERLGLDRSTVSNILRWFGAFSAHDAGAGEAALSAMRDGRLSESKARALAGLFDLAATESRAFVALATATPSVIPTLDTLVGMAVDAKSAADFRKNLDEVTRCVEMEVDRERRQREPEVFDEAPAAPDAEQDVPVENIDNDADAEPLTAEQAGAEYDRLYRVLVDAGHGPIAAEKLEGAVEEARALVAACDGSDRARGKGAQARSLLSRLESKLISVRSRLTSDAYDDGGDQLKAVAEGQGMEPFDASEEREHPALASAEEQARTADDEAREAEEWGALVHALAGLLATTPEPIRPIFARYIEAPGVSFEEFEDSWAGWMASGIVAGLELSAEGPREAAAELGVEVEWPDATQGDTDDAPAETITLTVNKGGERETPIRRRFESHGHEWAVVPTWKMADAGDLRLGDVLDVVHVRTGASLRVARQRLTVEEEAERAARAILDRQGPGKIEEAIVAHQDVTQSDAPDVSADTSEAPASEGPTSEDPANDRAEPPGTATAECGGPPQASAEGPARPPTSGAGDDSGKHTVIPSTEGSPHPGTGGSDEDAAFVDGKKPADAADPVAATRAALDAGDDPHLLRRSLRGRLKTVRHDLDALPDYGAEKEIDLLAVELEALDEAVVVVDEHLAATKTAPEVAA